MQFKIDAKTTLNEPVEIEIGKHVLKVRPQTLTTLKKVQKLWADMQAGSAEAISQGLAALFEGDVKVLEDLPIQTLAEVVKIAVEQSTKAGTEPKNS